MNRKKSAQLKMWLTAGGCGALSLALMGITLPKMSELDKLKATLKEWEPITQRAKNQPERPKKPEFPPDQDPRNLLPEQDQTLEFLTLLRKAGTEAGIASIPLYADTISKPSNWPPKADAATVKPDSYAEKVDPGAEGTTRIRRYLIHLRFSSTYASLVKFCEALPKIPQFSQICSLEINSNTGILSIVNVDMYVETYSLLKNK